MGMFFVYIIKVALLQTVFYLTYKLLLSRESFHAFNRGVLLTMQAAALLLPLMHITLETPAPVHQTIALAEAAFVQTAVEAEGDGAGLTLIQVLTLVWMAGFALLVLRSAVSLVRLALLLRSGRRCEVCGAEVTVVCGDRQPFSWFSRIVVSEKDCAAGAREIVIHEQEHVRRLHSLDIALCNTVIMFCWFSPAAWLLRAELRDVHEYEADEAVLRRGVDASGYQLLLIRKAVGERLFAMANNLNQTNLKKRIAMMKMKKSNPWNRFRAAAVLPLAAVSVFVFATPEAVRMADSVRMETGKAVSDVAVDDDFEIRDVADVKKGLPYGTCILMDGHFVTEETLNKLPVDEISSVVVIKSKDAMVLWGEKAKYGAVVVSTKNFARENNAKEGNHKGTIRLGGKMPDNNVAKRSDGYTLIVGTDGQDEKVKSDGGKDDAMENALIIIDDRRADRKQLKDLSSDEIEKVVVLKGENAVEAYGDDGKDGVIVVTTRKD